MMTRVNAHGHSLLLGYCGLVLVNVIMLQPCRVSCEAVVTVISNIDRHDRITERNETDLIVLSDVGL